MTSIPEPDAPVLVAGGTGKTGRRVAVRLGVLGHAVRAVGRTTDPPFDWDDQANWADVVAGTNAAYLAYAPDLAVPGSVDKLSAIAAEAVAAGTSRLVLLSGRGEVEAERAEEAVRKVADDGGATLTVVRAAWFAQNFSEGYLLDPVREGAIALPAGDTPEPFVDVDDVADVVVAALTDDRHAGETYEVTGPAALSFADAVGVLAATTGRDLRFVSLTMDEYEQGARSAGLPDDVISMLGYLFGELLDGRNARPGDGVQRALGREATDFASFAARAAATGVWSS